MKKSAIFSNDRKYRYVLKRIWDETLPMVVFIGLNPSTANEEDDDKTILNCIAIAKRHGYGGLRMMNLFAIVSTKPSYLLTCEDPLGRNEEFLLEFLCSDDDYVYCWGAFKEAQERADDVIEKYSNGLCLGQNLDGSPKHPCRLSHSTALVDYNVTKCFYI